MHRPAWSNRGMSDDIEQHLTAAAEAMREFEVCGQRRSDLRHRQDALAAELAAAREQCSDDDQDVERLEGLSLTRVLTSLRGSRNDALVRERAEADAARCRMADAQSRLDAVGRELAETEGRLDQLAGAPQAYSAALTQKERHLTESADPRGSALLRMADDRGRLTAEVNEMTRAQQAADAAAQALSQVRTGSEAHRAGPPMTPSSAAA
jgi:chromosome segregation ATPase